MTRGHVIAAGPQDRRLDSRFRTPRSHRLRNPLRHARPTMCWPASPTASSIIGGGPPVWAVYAPFIRHWDITRLPYDGEADRWFDPAWLVAG